MLMIMMMMRLTVLSVSVSGAAVGHGLPPNVFMPQDLSVRSAQEDESLPTSCLSYAIADTHLLRPPQIAGRYLCCILKLATLLQIS